MADPNEQVHLNTNEARGGSTPGVVRYVLSAGLALVIVVFLVIFLS